ncbi:putative reverse transcriptase zinc-binding domain-containing protein [Helianthus annuus]|nr:putative reverse transcriptase zinc-binding domain-containing protein [Helianthus annuus]KAJ0730507.1 putative reverse transcriptase zinc-binding domain-containing protein [Helianthus annuus]
MGVETEALEDMAASIGCKSGEFPFTYLGLRVGANMNRVTNWSPIYDIFDARLSRWKASLLSIGGRVILIKAVLECLPNYYFSLYKDPCTVINDLEAKIKRFLWGGEDGNKKLHWVAWNTVTLPKKQGGLGISRLKNSNISLLSKWGWRLKTDKNKLWVKVIEAIHKTRFNWEFIPARKSLGGVWCNIAGVLSKTVVGGRPLRNFFKSKIGNGNNTSFWLDLWLCNEPLKNKYPELFKLEKVKRCKVADRLKHGTVERMAGQHFEWEWSRPISAGVEVDELVDLCSKLLEVRIVESCDSWEWIGADDKDFSVGAVKRLLNEDICDAQNHLDRPEECKWIPETCNIFLWRTAMNKIATVEALRRRNIVVQEGVCALCGDGEDSVSHIFPSCFVSTVVWNHISKWGNIQSLFFFSFNDITKIHDHVGLKGDKKEAFKGIMRIACWTIWKARNKRRFDNKDVKIEEIISEIKATGFLWFKNRTRFKDISWND